MRSYCISDLSSEAVTAISTRLQEMDLAASIEGLYWLPIPPRYLSDEQRRHQDSCGPYAMSLDVGKDSVSLELLVRARNRLRCSCIHYASPELQDYMIRYLMEMLGELHVDA